MHALVHVVLGTMERQLQYLCDRTPKFLKVECPQFVNKRSVLVDQDSIYQLCGFGTTASSHYLDDQVSVSCIILIESQRGIFLGDKCISKGRFTLET